MAKEARYKFSIKNTLFQFICFIGWTFLGIGGMIGLFLGAPLALIIGLFWHMAHEEELKGETKRHWVINRYRFTHFKHGII